MALDRRAVGMALSEAMGLGILALLVYYISISGAEQVAGAWAIDRVVAYTLLFTGSLLVFWPFSSALRLGPLWLLGAGSWTLLGYVLLFVGAPSREAAGFFTYVAFLAVVLVALATALAVPLAAIGGRLLPPVSRTSRFVRALREGGLLALFGVALLAMSPLGVLNWLNALLVFTIVALTEFFFLARD